jgi:hypothetical protein
VLADKRQIFYAGKKHPRFKVFYLFIFIWYVFGHKMEKSGLVYIPFALEHGIILKQHFRIWQTLKVLRQSRKFTHDD